METLCAFGYSMRTVHIKDRQACCRPVQFMTCAQAAGISSSIVSTWVVRVQ